jgi:hypothetical protein
MIFELIKKREYKLVGVILTFFIIQNTTGQDTITSFKYSDILGKNYIVISDSLYDFKRYRESVDYNLVRIKEDSKQTVYYNLAQSYSKMGQIDSAYFYLNCYLNIDKPDDFRSVLVEEDFEILKTNALEWDKIVSKIETLYFNELDSNSNKKYALQLFYLGIQDQFYSSYYKISCRTKRVESITQIKNQIANQKKLKKLIKKYGFPTISKVGLHAQFCAFLIIQHSDIQEKYYLLAKEAYEKNDYHPACYALLTDRWLIQNGKPQRYGTQIRTITEEKDGIISKKKILSPIESLEGIDEIRIKMKLPPLNEYMQFMNATIPKEYYK